MGKTLSVNTSAWNIVYAVYYSVAAVVIFFMMKPFSSIGMSLRILFFVAVFVPVLFRISLFLPVFYFFVTISTHSFLPFLPTQPFFYLALALVMLPFVKRRRFDLMLFIIPLFFVLSDMVHSNIASWSLWIFIVVFLSIWIFQERDIDRLVLAIMLTSVFLSLLYISNFAAFEWVKHTSDDEYHTTSGWMNHNRFDAALGCGALLGVATLLNVFPSLKNKSCKIIAITALSLTFVVMLMDVSRGAIVSLAGGAIILLLFCKTNVKIKIFVIAALLVFVFVSIFSGATDYLQSRFTDSTMGTAGSRSRIWEVKFRYFLEDSDFSAIMFGIGRARCNALGNNMSTHNDWLTAFFAFGMVGVACYSLIFIIPLLKMRNINGFSLAVLMFVLLESVVLEPFFRGNPQILILYVVGLRYMEVRNRDMMVRKKRIKQFGKTPVFTSCVKYNQYLANKE